MNQAGYRCLLWLRRLNDYYMHSKLPYIFLMMSIVLGYATLFLPLAQLDIQSIEKTKISSKATIYFWEEKASIPYSSSCSVEMIEGVSPAVENRLKLWQTAGWGIFYAQIGVWFVFVLARINDIKNRILNLSAVQVILILVLLCFIGLTTLLFIGPVVSACFWKEASLQKVSLFWPTMTISLVSLGLGMSAVFLSLISRNKVHYSA